MINGLIGIFIFAFIWGLGFFKTANQFTNTYTTTQTIEFKSNQLQIIENDAFTNEQWINWVENIEFIPTNNDVITVDVTSTINRSSQEQADNIFSKLIPLNNQKLDTLDLSIYKKTDFSKEVPYAFLRKNIKIYLPKDANITLWNIQWDNINRISNLYYQNSYGEERKVWWLNQCQNSSLQYDPSSSVYNCSRGTENIQHNQIEIDLKINLEEELDKSINAIDEIDVIIDEEIQKIEN
jgi:hypothetical protein